MRQLRDALDISADGETEYTLKQRSVALDKELLQLVQGACKADNLQRALDLTRLMHNPATVEAAAKIAGFYHLPGLQERISAVSIAVERKKRRRPEARHSTYAPASYATSSASASAIPPTKGFSDFAPRDKPRRSFGGKVRDRDSTPASTATATPFVPETPHADMDDDDDMTPAPMAAPTPASPEYKRKRDDPAPVPGDEENFAPRAEPAAAKNPFAKKAAGNPFAKPAVAKPLDAIKSTSFFDRVDTIESSGAAAGGAAKKPKHKKTAPAPAPTDKAGGQQTLFSYNKPSLGPKGSIAMTETDPEEVPETMPQEDESEELQEAQPISVSPTTGFE